MKQRIALLLAVVLLVAAFAACGSAEPAAGEAGTAATAAAPENAAGEAASGEPMEIVLWEQWGSASTKPAVEWAFDEFNKSQSEIVLKYEMIPRADLIKQYTLGVVAGTLPDLGSADNPDHASLASMGVFKDITDWYDAWDQKQFFLEGVVDACYLDDRLYGLPVAPNCLALYSNMDLLRAAGIEKPPETWEELKDAAVKTTSDGVYGFLMSAVKDESGTFQHMPILESSGGSLFDLGSEDSKRSMRFIKELFDLGTISMEALNWGQGDTINQFIAGNNAMNLNGSWYLVTVREGNPAFEWTVSNIPRDKEFVSSLGGETLGLMSSVSDEKAAACYEFLDFFLSKEINAEVVSMCTRFSPRSDLTGEDLYPGDPEMASFIEVMKVARSRGPHPKYTEISAAFQTAFQEMWTGAKPVDQAMDEADAKIEEIMSAE